MIIFAIRGFWEIYIFILYKYHTSSISSKQREVSWSLDETLLVKSKTIKQANLRLEICNNYCRKELEVLTSHRTKKQRAWHRLTLLACVRWTIWPAFPIVTHTPPNDSVAQISGRAWPQFDIRGLNITISGVTPASCNRGSECRILLEGRDIVRRKEQILLFCTFGGSSTARCFRGFLHVNGSIIML
jgi:hypothetical protein